MRVHEMPQRHQELARVIFVAVRKRRPDEIKTGVSFKTGAYQPDFVGLATSSVIILPWDREIISKGELVVRPEYAAYVPADAAARTSV